MTDHDCGPLDPCPVCEADKAAYAQGRADERAAIVAWLLTDAPGLADTRAHIAALISTGSVPPPEHER